MGAVEDAPAVIRVVRKEAALGELGQRFPVAIENVEGVALDRALENDLRCVRIAEGKVAGELAQADVAT